MKINKPDFNTLTLETNTLFFKLFGLIFLVAGIVMLYFMTDSYTLKCEKRKSQCVLTHHQWLLNHERAIEHIKRAKITHSRNKQGNKNYYLKLKTSEGNLKLNQIASPSKTALRKNALTINRYIRTPRKGSIIIGNLYPFWIYIIPIAFIIASNLMLFLPKKTYATFDKNKNLLAIQRKNLFSKATENHVLNDIEKVILEDGTGKNGRVYRIAFVFKDGCIVPFSKVYDNFLPSKIKAMDAICDFLALVKDPKLETLNKNNNRLATVLFCIALSIITMSIYLMHAPSGTFLS